MFDFNKANTDIENTKPLVDISNRVMWDTMLMSEKLKYLMGINNFAAIMKHGNLLTEDSLNKVTVNINIYIKLAVRNNMTFYLLCIIKFFILVKNV